MIGKKDKIVSYRRATWFIEHPETITFRGCVKQASDKLTSIQERTVILSAQHLKMAHLTHDEHDGMYIHLTSETPGEAASVIPHVSGQTSEVKVGTAPPPRNTEFMDRDAFIYARGNHVCLCTTGLHESTVAHFFREFFLKANFRRNSDQFDFLKVADISKVSLILAQGVKEIDLRAVLHDASMQYQKRQMETPSILGAIGKQVKHVLGLGHDASQDAMQIAVTISTDKRRKGLVVGQKRIQDLALNLIKNQQDQDDFVIVTNNDERIGPKEILIKSVVSIDAVGKSVARDDAWEELFKFFNELFESGALEQ